MRGGIFRYFLSSAMSRPLAWAVVVAVVCWLLTVGMAADFSATSGGLDWRAAGFAPLFVMWAVMMAAMMLPSFLPAASYFFRLSARRASGSPAAAVAAFIGGYLFVWGGFSVAATVFQQLSAKQLAAALYLDEPLLRAALLFAAGVWQFTSVKFSCLKNCRHPIFFFLLNWREGVRGAWRMGFDHGIYCLGCCWLLMLLLFVGGVMDLRWIALLTLYVFAEKLLPLPPRLVARTMGGFLIVAAVAVAAA